MSDSLELLFLGTGTSAGVPMIGCRCDVCHSPDPRDKRTRPSVVISRGSSRVLVDTTPERRRQGRPLPCPLGVELRIGLVGLRQGLGKAFA